MNTFVSNFLKTKIGTAFSEGKGLLNAPYQRINEALTKFKTQLTKSNPRYDSLICALTQDPELLSDNMVSGGAVSVVDGIDYSEIEDDVAQNLYNGVLEAITNNGEEDANDGLTITDSKGYSYAIINQAGDGSTPLQFGNYDVYLSQTRVVSKISEATLYKVRSSNKWRFNNIIRTADFVKRNPTPSKATTLLGKLNTILALSTGITKTTIVDACVALSGYPFESPMNTIRFQLSVYASSIGLDPGMIFADGLMHGVDIMEDIAIQHYVESSGRGRFSTVWSVMHDLIEASCLNSAILSMIQSVQSFTAISDATFDVVLEKVGNKFSSVNQFINNAKTAWHTGSFVGLGSYILSYAKAMSKVTDSDGLISFSDNKDLVPQQYIAGMVFQVISVVVTFVGIIVSIFSKIIGAIVTVLGGILSALVNVITNDHDRTYAALQNDTNIFYPISPYALYQFTSSSTGLNPEVQSAFENGAELVTVQVPGGYVVIGPSQVDNDMLEYDYASWTDKYPQVIFKFYPSIVPHNASNALSNLIRRIHDDFTMFSDPSFDISQTNHTIRMNKECVKQWLDANNYDINYLIEEYAHAEQDIDYVEDDSLLVKDVLKDIKLRKTILENCAWFILWLIAYRGQMSEFPDQAPGYLAVSDVEIDNECWFYPLVIAAPYHLFKLWTSSSDPSYSSYLTYNDYGWHDIGEFAVACNLAPYGHDNITCCRNQIYNGYYIDEPYETSARMGFIIKTPEYDPATFWAWLIMSTLVVAVIAVVTIVASVKLKKAINRRRAINQSKVESAWENLKSSPTAENYDVYRKTVKKNNLWAKFIGGTRYDYVNYWNGDVSKDNGSLTGSVTSGLFDPISNESNLDTTQNPQTDNHILDVVYLIRGSN